MPRTSAYTLVWLAQPAAYELRKQGKTVGRFLSPGDEQWIAQAASLSSFSFEGQHGHLTLLKETRARGNGYWYAYRTQNGRTLKQYVGSTPYLTIAHLEEIAQVLTARQYRATLGSKGQKENTASIYAPLLLSKLRLPHLPTPLVLRERLLTQLDEALEHKLTLVSAPAGFGKTTLISQWIADRTSSTHARPLTIAWISLDAGDNDPIRFWHYIFTACQKFAASVGHSALLQLRSGWQPPFEHSQLETSLTTFLNELSALTNEGLLVLEDYHLITEAQIHETLAFVLEHLPSALHVLLITRSEPPLPLARLRASGDLYELHAADLRFSSTETEAFLQQAMPLRLSPQAIRQIEIRLEGWAAGLRLVTHALHRYSSSQEAEHFLLNFAGSHRSVLEYFVTELLETQPEPLQRFLLLTSGLSRLTGPLCDALLGRKDSTQYLETLARSNLFLEALDASGRWYRYHTLFAEAMQHEARRRLGEEALRDAFHKASLWYEEHGLQTEAIEAALQSQNMLITAELIEHFIDSHEIHGFRTLQRWLEQVPEGVLSVRPTLCLSYASVIMFSSPYRLPPATLAQIEKLLQAAEQGWQHEQNKARLGEVFAFRSLIAWRHATLKQAITYAEQALACLPREELPWRSISLSVIGMAEASSGQLSLARTRLEEAKVLCETIGNHHFSRPTTIMLGSVCVEQGELHLAAKYYRQALTNAKEHEDLSDIAHAQLSLAQLSYEWNDLAEARQIVSEVLTSGLPILDEEIRLNAHLLLAHIDYAQGEPAAAIHELGSLLDWLQSHNLHSFTRAVLAHQVQFELACGDLAAICRWLTLHERFDSAPSFALHEQEVLLMARWHLSQDKPMQALSLLNPVLEAAYAAGRIQSVLKLQVLMARAEAASRQGHEARQRLQAVLSRAYSEGYLRLFLDEGVTLIPLLQAILAHLHDRPLSAYLQTILQAFSAEHKDERNPYPSDYASLTAPLSPQELRVLRLLSAGRSNPEIARELVVSVNTIRSQVQSIYRKLNVNNRIAAMELARHLHLQK